MGNNNHVVLKTLNIVILVFLYNTSTFKIHFILIMLNPSFFKKTNLLCNDTTFIQQCEIKTVLLIPCGISPLTYTKRFLILKETVNFVRLLAVR